ncbi:MAG TPA: aminotransferase class III-fold pyridoxal phosphate-dependent enzyme [Candidatus Saccharicenans sp.]|jgi:glutamate-1-semialdehyde 2,1-aminomutase|nr:aminotransferase class III-fold pyridoxal phosphate-dependent enzyme [Candidatus Saccharicenans sp.]HRD02385.1 aminotransferase class III-fold pyridoxal phosphate-dependent enzyme [Candidatus Saccharicenans sp.]
MKQLIDYLDREYEKKTRKSCQMFQRAAKVMVRGGSHSLRLWKPYPFFPVSAHGATVTDLDGHNYLDYWQGHYANLLGHNPEVIRRELEPYLAAGALHTGFENSVQIELAEKILSSLGQPGLRIRFTTSGTLASTYAVMLAMGYTGRHYVLKIGGGWHGSSPYLLKGVKFHPGRGFSQVDSAGLPPEFARHIIITRFNDSEHLEKTFKKYGPKLAAFILEPFIGVGGFLFCSPEYLKLARKLADEYGVVLVFDEIISGFRFCSSGLQRLYGVRPDMSLFGKLIGGGEAVAAVVGKAKIMEGCERTGTSGLRVNFEGGTFSAHEEYMRAGLAMLNYLICHEKEIYPRIGQLAARLRQGIEQAFASEGLRVVCTGTGRSPINGSSFFMVNFPKKDNINYSTPEDIWDPARSDVFLREEALKLALLINGVHVVHGGGCLSTAHTEKDIERTIEAYQRAARIFKKFW